MKKQSITHGTLASSATNSHLKGFQQYFTPEPWARALGAALPMHRRTIFDPHCGDGSLLRGLANATTRDVLGLDLDPAAGLGGKTEWTRAIGGDMTPLRSFAHGDILDLYPLLEETDSGFDLIVANPPFSLNWPLELLHGPLRQGLSGKSIDSTLATIRMIPPLLSRLGEGMLIANAATLDRLREEHPEDFEQVWLHLDIPSFFPGVSSSLRVGVLYFTSRELEPLESFRESWDARITPDETAEILDRARRKHFKAHCIEEAWEQITTSTRMFEACADEMKRRRDPAASNANVTLDSAGNLRTWVSMYQEKSVTVPANMREFLRSINRQHPISLTLQRGSRLALAAAIRSGIWTIDPAAQAALDDALVHFNQERAPLSPISNLQRIGWIDDAETLLCTADYQHFKAGQHYELSTQTIEWAKEEIRPRYHAGKLDKETVRVRGTDLRITLHHPDGPPAYFIYNPDRLPGTEANPVQSLDVMAAHFDLPEVEDISAIRADDFARNLALLDELERSTA